MWNDRPEERKNIRLSKVNHLLRGELANILSREVKDPRVGKLTVTEINVSPDLRQAQISVCRFLGDDLSKSQVDEIEKGLKAASQFIYETLKRRLCLKAIPSLHFRYDPTLSKVTHVWNLMNNVDKPKGEILDEAIDETQEEALR